MSCPLCACESVAFYFEDRVRKYWQCQRCQMVYVPTCYHLSREQEKAEYDKHQNCSDDLGYRSFLSRLVTPLQRYLPVDAAGLDFGCGPGPTVSIMMAEQGWAMDLYDIFYYPNPAVLNNQYDFITATEVVEHLLEPGRVLNNLWQQIKAGGYLALMTKILIDKQAFSSWHYKNDPTHICFFAAASFEYMAAIWGAELTVVDKDVVLFKKTAVINCDI